NRGPITGGDDVAALGRDADVVRRFLESPDIYWKIVAEIDRASARAKRRMAAVVNKVLSEKHNDTSFDTYEKKRVEVIRIKNWLTMLNLVLRFEGQDCVLQAFAATRGQGSFSVLVDSKVVYARKDFPALTVRPA